MAEYTRAQIIAMFADEGHTLRLRQLQQWATKGRIPHPVRKRPPGTNGHAYAIYGDEHVAAIRALLAPGGGGQGFAPGRSLLRHLRAYAHTRGIERLELVTHHEGKRIVIPIPPDSDGSEADT